MTNKNNNNKNEKKGAQENFKYYVKNLTTCPFEWAVKMNNNNKII